MASFDALTEAEKRLIPSYKHLWQDITFSTTRLNRNQVQGVIQSIYSFFGLSTPDIYYCRGPYELVARTKGLYQQLYYSQDGLVFPTPVMAGIHDRQLCLAESIGDWDRALSDQLNQVNGACMDHHLS